MFEKQVGIFPGEGVGGMEEPQHGLAAWLEPEERAVGAAGNKLRHPSSGRYEEAWSPSLSPSLAQVLLVTPQTCNYSMFDWPAAQVGGCRSVRCHAIFLERLWVAAPCFQSRHVRRHQVCGLPPGLRSILPNTH